MRSRLLAIVLLLASSCTSPSESDHEPPQGWNAQVALAEAKDLAPADDVLEVKLTASERRVALYDGKRPKLWTYGDTMPGPLLHAKVGDTLRVHFDNRLPEATTIHWHGLEVPARMDGAEHSQPPIEPGASFDYEFVLKRAGTFWYHPHLDSSAQLWRGLYGAIQVDDPDEPFLGYETVLVLDDISLGDDGELTSPEENGNLGDYFGREGDHVLVNGRVLPTLYARSGDALRLHLLNAANSRYFDVAVEGTSLTRVGGDSGLLARPEHTDHVLLVPGERTDLVLVPVGKVGQRIRVYAQPYSRFQCGGGCAEEAELLTIQIVKGKGSAPDVPEQLATIDAIDVTHAKQETIQLTEGAQNGMAVLSLNGHVYDVDPLVLHATTNSSELWTIENTTEYDHPFHLHGFRFQVLDRAGVAPAIREWKDTLNMPAMTSARIAFAIDDRPGMWMFHCHILDHAKIGMMGMLHVADGVP